MLGSETVKEQHGVCCPNCNTDDELEISVLMWTRLHHDGAIIQDGDQIWDEKSLIRCNHCNHSGTVGEFSKE